MTQEPRPTPELWRLEYLRKWHGQPELIRCVKWFESELCATLHLDDIANGKGEFVSLAKYVAVDPAYVLPDPPMHEPYVVYALTPEQVKRARVLVTKHDHNVYGPNTWREVIELLREVVGDE